MRSVVVSIVSAALIAAAAYLAGSFDRVSSASAQGQSSGPISIPDVFETLLADVKLTAYDKLKEAANRPAPQGECPSKAKFKVYSKRSADPLFDDALGDARKEVLKAWLQSQGIAPDRYSVEDGGTANQDDVQVDYENMRDRERPTLTTRSRPRKGTKVKAGDRITVTMTARDDVRPETTPWQTGIKLIQLTADDGLVDSKDYGRVPGPCGSRLLTQTFEKTYAVPENPPPIVHLRAIAEDFTGNQDSDLGDFPTGDWYGTFEYGTIHSFNNVNPMFEVRADLVLEHDGRGNLTGSMVGTHTIRDQRYGGPAPYYCEYKMTNPGNFRVRLIGSYTAGRNTLSVRVAEVDETKLAWTHACKGGLSVNHQSGFENVWFPGALLGPGTGLGEGALAADGSRQYKLEYPPERGNSRWSVTLRPAEQ